ncbi:YitT family protein [Paraclostridium sordellii]|uniref:Membrane protein n=1 Tax=Paraclostridium sordellii TaxID=1505 RepID=A0A0C7PSB9_PARSO|nr:YitT family protein [Paeniclostridium sordellii]QYE99256.1 YitT family protein [Paeniclostridium sordellii]CEN78055.1 membrane protein [[Clostridium] sordellii] [Paeniclostridium sordellii]CEO07347.1 membrane protein [[Clostridium] sordellii] [Paeniclostridium sordellii]CEP80192.1 membrane protein [[Clostridium] sordellii] [Paeniclostridium sordellii]CEP86859.1 membrane protein [[Clostridium] sordellii] [Paeniclostridium sordellii]
MSEVKNTLDENIFLRYIVITAGITISSIGINGFLKPAHLLGGGVAGLSVALNYVSNMNIGVLSFLINIPIFILGFIFLEKEFCITSLVNMLIFSTVLGLTQNIGHYIPVNDVLLQTVYGGILGGIGLGLVFKAKSSLGGTDIIAAILKIKRNIPMKDTGLFMNFLIVCLGSALFGLELGLYTLIGMFLNVYSMNIVKDMMNTQKSVMLISSRSDDISKCIMKDLIRGVTLIEAEGAYTHEKKKIVYCIVASNEIPKIKEIALKYDKKAFISVNDVNEVKGRGFKEKYL